MRLSRLSGRKVCEYVLRKGNLWKGKTMLIRWLPGPPRSLHRRQKPGIYAGTLASTRLHKSAVKRNRMRRRCREALRVAVQKQSNLPSVQLLIIPRLDSLRVPFAVIEEDIRRFLQFLPPCL